MESSRRRRHARTCKRSHRRSIVYLLANELGGHCCNQPGVPGDSQYTAYSSIILAPCVPECRNAIDCDCWLGCSHVRVDYTILTKPAQSVWPMTDFERDAQRGAKGGSSG